MKHKQRVEVKNNNRPSRRFFVAAHYMFIAGVLALSNVFLTVQPAFAAQSAADYCNQYTTPVLKNACKAGVNGQEDCEDYALIADQAAVDICKKAERDKAAGLVTPGSVTVTPTPTPLTPPPNNARTDQIQGPLNRANSIDEYIDILHGAGPDSEVDTDEIPSDKLEAYINGAGEEQDIITLNKGAGNSPAILFINGGGWHINDCMGQRVAAGGGNMCNVKDEGIEKAGDRGYAMYDLTYRLGSSGVYYMFEDVMRGIRHIRNNASRYGIDPNKIVIWGDSAGGSLAMRAAASGKSGAKAAVGWSALTNAYKGLFKSFQSFAIGVDHSTCAPTDLAGFANFADLANGGSGTVAEYGRGLSSNDFSALGISLDGSSTGSINPLSLLTQGLVAGQNLLSASEDIEAISSQIKSKGSVSGMSGSSFNLASKKFVECLDNFNVLSPALFASPDTPPSYLAGFENDGLFDATQSYDMRDKLRQLGVKSDVLILPGSEDCAKPEKAAGPAGGCHLGYYGAFVCQTLNFIDSEVQPERGTTDCATGVAESEESGQLAADSGGGVSPSGDNSNSGQNSANAEQSESKPKSPCDAEGYQIPGGPAGPCPKGVRPNSNVQNQQGVQKPPCDSKDSKCSNPAALPRAPAGAPGTSTIGAARPAVGGQGQVGGNVYVDPKGNRVSGPSGNLNDLGWANDDKKPPNSLPGIISRSTPIGAALTLLKETPLGGWSTGCLFGSCSSGRSEVNNSASIPLLFKPHSTPSIIELRR